MIPGPFARVFNSSHTDSSQIQAKGQALSNTATGPRYRLFSVKNKIEIPYDEDNQLITDSVRVKILNASKLTCDSSDCQWSSKFFLQGVPCRIRGKRESTRDNLLILERRVETCSPYLAKMNIKVTLHHSSFDQSKVRTKETGFHVYDDRNLGWACLVPGETAILDPALGYMSEDRITFDLEVNLDTSYAHYFIPRIYPINVKPVDPKYELSAKLFMNFCMSDVTFKVKNGKCSHDFVNFSQVYSVKSDSEYESREDFTLFPAHRMLLLEESPSLVKLIDDSATPAQSPVAKSVADESNGFFKLNGSSHEDSSSKSRDASQSIAGKLIAVKDTNCHAFYTLLRFIYTGTLIINPFNTYKTLHTLTRYLKAPKLLLMYEAIKRTSAHFVILDLYIYAFDFNNSTLLQMAYDLMDEHAESIMPSDTFYHLPYDLVLNIVKRPSLKITEITLFNCLVKWSRVQCQKNLQPLTSENQRKSLSDLLNYIQFNCMTTTEFAMGPLRSNLLTPDEISTVSMSKVSLGKSKESTLMKRSNHPNWISPTETPSSADEKSDS